MTVEDLVGLVGKGSGERRRAPYFRTKKLAIVGCTQSHRFTPWSDPSWTIASHASARNYVRREPDWWFDLHRRECFTMRKNFHKTYYQWLQHQQTPIFMQEDYPDIPAAIRYPKERILSEFRPYFTNHVAWMIALAMTEGVTHIGLFGCQYKHETEHGVQRESCVYWMGRFEGAGGTLVLPPVDNTLLTEPKELYGYESHDEKGRLIPSYYRAPSIKPDAKAEEGPMKILADGEVPTHRSLSQPVAWERAGYAKELIPA